MSSLISTRSARGEAQHKLRARKWALAYVIQLRLEESRTLVELMQTKRARAQMQAIARGYDKLVNVLTGGE